MKLIVWATLFLSLLNYVNTFRMMISSKKSLFTSIQHSSSFPSTISSSSSLYGQNENSNGISSTDEQQPDAEWMNEGNKIEYVVGPFTQQYSSLEELGISINKQKNITIIPFHLTSSSDLFCNRELNMEHIDCIGFDMDFTLAQYKEDFDLLAYNGAVNLLVETMGYPSELYSYKYKQSSHRRGCVIDKKRGNILKMDRFKYVRVAEHGLTKLQSVERKALYKYNHEGIHEMTSENFINIDTPFSLIDACLFSQLGK